MKGGKRVGAGLQGGGTSSKFSDRLHARMTQRGDTLAVAAPNFRHPPTPPDRPRTPHPRPWLRVPALARGCRSSVRSGRSHAKWSMRKRRSSRSRNSSIRHAPRMRQRRLVRGAAGEFQPASADGRAGSRVGGVGVEATDRSVAFLHLDYCSDHVMPAQPASGVGHRQQHQPPRCAPPRATIAGPTQPRAARCRPPRRDGGTRRSVALPTGSCASFGELERWLWHKRSAV
eukprot:359692-Chlamydomonas_euryale.AAC.7